jgi:hypothetical protein
MQLGECADFLCPFIWSHVSGLMQYHDGSDKRTVITVLLSDPSQVITGDESWIYGYDPD